MDLCLYMSVDAVWVLKQGTHCKPLLTASVCSIPVPSGLARELFMTRLSKVPTPDSAAVATQHHPPPPPHLGNSCGYLYRWGATEKMRSGQGEKQQKSSNERSPEVLTEPWGDAENIWQAEARAIILPGLLQNYMQLLMIKHFVRQC